MDAASQIFKTIDDLRNRSADRFYSHGAITDEPNRTYSAWHLHEVLPTGDREFPEIRRLYLQECALLQSLDWLKRFQNLELLWIYGADKLTSLEGVQHCKDLKSLTVWASFTANITLDSLAPVAALKHLEELNFSGKTRDGALDHLSSNLHLRDVFFSNSYTWEEIARFEACHPKANFPWKGGITYDANPTVLKCKKCERAQAMLSGKGLKLSCPQCDAAYIQKHLDRYHAIAID